MARDHGLEEVYRARLLSRREKEFADNYTA